MLHLIVEIEIAAHRIQPLKKHGARIGFLFDQEKLLIRLRQLFDEGAARRIGSLAAFNAKSVEAGQPTLRGSAIWTMRILLVAVEIRPCRGAAGEFLNRGCVAFDFGERCARRESQLFGKDVKNASMKQAS